MSALLVLAGVAAVGAGGVLAVARRTLTHGLGLQAAGCAAIGAGGLWALAAGDASGSAFTSAFDPRIGIDPLSGLFLGILGAVGAAALVFATRYLGPSGRGRAVGALTALFVVLNALWSAPGPTGAGLAIILAGLPLYLVLRSRRGK